MSKPNFPGRQSLLKVNRYSLMMRPSATSDSVPRRDPSLPLRGRPSKRVKMEYMSAAIRHQHSPSSFIMKLFDRSVDLAKFRDGTALYPVCRAWMRNDPRGHRKKQREEKEEETPETTREVQPDLVDRYKRKELDQIEKMPPAEEDNGLEPYVLEERFPKDAEAGKEGDSDNGECSREELLKGHKERWIGMKRRWVDHRKNYLAKYQQSYDLLDAIMMKQA